MDIYLTNCKAMKRERITKDALAPRKMAGPTGEIYVLLLM